MKFSLKNIDAYMQPVSESGCWLWMRHCEHTGYGVVRIQGRNWQAHRATWALFYGPIPKDLKVLHHCDTRSCINPSHLFLGTQADNISDMLKKMRGRISYGEAHHKAKLTLEDVELIREKLQHGEPISTLSKQFHVSAHSIRMIKTGRSWTRTSPVYGLRTPTC